MNIDIKMIAKRLSHYDSELIISDETLVLLNTVKLYYEEQVEFKPNTLYVGKLSDFPKTLPATGCINIVCILDMLSDLEQFKNEHINLLILTKNCELGVIFNSIQDIFLAEQKITNSSAKLLNAIIQGRGFQHILNIGYDIIKNPIVLFDSNTNLIARSKDIDTDDPLLSELLINGCFSKETFAFMEAIDFSRIHNNRYPYIFKTDKLKHDRIIGNVYIHGLAIATIVVVENGKYFDEEDIAFVSQLCDILSSEMQKNKIYQNLQEVSLETFISDILDFKLKKNIDIQKRAAALNWKIKDTLFLIVIDINIYTNEIASIRSKLDGMISDSYVYIYNNYVLIILNRDQNQINPDVDFKELEAFLKENCMMAGLSSSFHNFIDLPIIYKNTIKAIELGNRICSQYHENSVIFSYDLYQITHLLDTSSINHNVLEFCHPTVNRIIQYDKDNGTEYGKTLYIYIINFKDSLKTSEILHTHRNTILYRIEKIKDLFNIDFHNGNLLIRLYISFKILEL